MISHLKSPRRSLLLGSLALSAALALSACSGGAQEPTATEAGSAGAFGASANAPLDVYIFDGGYGAEYADGFVDVYNQTIPGSTVEISAVQEIATQLQPRFVAGDPPDVVDNSGKAIELTTLVNDGQLHSLNDLLEAPSLDDENVKIKDTLTTGVTAVGTYGDDFLVLPYVNTVVGMWYSKSLFEENGWEVPQTWDEFIALGEEAAKQDIALFAYPGQAIGYAGNLWVGLAGKEGGIDVLKNLDNLKPGAWKDPAVVGAFEALAELHEKGLILEGSEALQHTEAQTSFVLGEALFYPSGSWLENEMKNLTPEGFEMSVAPFPLLSDGAVLDYTAIEVSPGENFIVPANAKNPEGGMEFLRSMLTKEAAQNFSRLTGAPTVVKGALEGVELTPGLTSATEAIDNATETDVRVRFRSWYADLRTVWFESLADVLAGRADAETVTDRLQAAADAVAADDSIVKYTRD
ncbi:MAG: N-acetylglucosamine/diacetylchitobiose ABC transporter substrate-binding protein [Propioniciclava sp.]